MKTNVERARRAWAWLGVACLGLLHTSSLSAQEPRLRATLNGHTESVQSVAFCPDGKMLASASKDKSIKLWDVQTGKEQASLKGHTESVLSVAFSPDGKMLASASEDETVKLWDVDSLKNTATLRGQQKYVRSVAFSPDGKTLASGGSGPPVQLWDVATGKKGVALESDSKEGIRSAWCVTFSPDGKTLGAGGQFAAGWAGLWDLTLGQYTQPPFGQVQGVHSVAFSLDGKVLAVGSALTGKIKLLDVRDSKNLPKPVDIEARSEFVSSVAFSPDSKTLASGGKNIMLWDIRSRKHIAILKEHTQSVLAVAFSPDGTMLASGSHDRMIKLWDIPASKQADK